MKRRLRLVLSGVLIAAMAGTVWGQIVPPSRTYAAYLKLGRLTPTSVVDTLTNPSGVLTYNGTAVAVGGGSPSFLTGTFTDTASLTLGTASSKLGQMLLKNSTNANVFTLQPGVTGAALSWTLPIAAPGGNNYLVNAQTTGALGYTDPASFLSSATPVTAPQGGTGQSVYAVGDTLYASATNALQKLAVVADKKVFGNAGGTAPEYSTGIKLGTFTYDTSTATGTQAITGVGFKPSNVIFLAIVDSTTEMSIGFDDGSTRVNVVNYNAVTPTLWVNGTRSLTLYQATGNAKGYIASLDADGFTITWTKTGTKTGTASVYYMAFR